MNENRLEEIKNKWEDTKILYSEDINWLIEQAERVQELDTSNKFLEGVNGMKSVLNDKAIEIIEGKEEEVKRYRELLHDMYYSQNVSIDYFKNKIRKVLEESK